MIRKYLISLALLCPFATMTAQERNPETEILLSRNKEFKEEIVKLADNVYTAVGYDVSNIAMIIGEDGVVLIDAGMIPQITSHIYDEFRKITDKPIKGVVFTHGHGDHTKGLPPFLKDNQPRIWAAENFGVEDDFPKAVGFVNPRSYRQGGFKLSPDKRINNGIAPARYPGGKDHLEEAAKMLYWIKITNGLQNYQTD